MSNPAGRPPLALLAVFGVFLVALGYLVISSIVAREAPTFAPNPPGTSATAKTPGATDTMTIDTSDPDRWRLVDLDLGIALEQPDTAGWDIALRRYHAIANDAIADAGVIPFESLAQAPATTYIPNSIGTDTINPAIDRWYSYGMLSHLLEPKGRVYVVRTDEGGYIKLEFLSYYCPEMRPGCLTFRYATTPAPPQTPIR